jgi:multidrug resistance efflux pump
MTFWRGATGIRCNATESNEAGAAIARGINVPNAQPDGTGLASVNPIFTWVRLGQRVPVHIRIDLVPDDVCLVAGLTATLPWAMDRQIEAGE